MIGTYRLPDGRPLLDDVSFRLGDGVTAALVLAALLRGPDEVLLLDEPTDNLDLASADALQHGLRAFTGTVLAITHDRWFATDFDRYLHFTRTGTVREVPAPVWS